MQDSDRVAILGAGNIGTLIARGLAREGGLAPGRISVTRRRVHLLDELKREGFAVDKDNAAAVRAARIVIVAVEPQQIDGLLDEIKDALIPKKHVLVSVVSGVRIDQIRRRLGGEVRVVRAMPNTAIGIGESMTCLTANENDGASLELVEPLFATVGKTIVIEEEEMIAATALGACGVAFFLRAIRAASQGGVEIGFDFEAALVVAAQTAKGAASLLLQMQNHPEYEIDRVATPRGCTISGLNQMEHEGFSSAMIKGIVTSGEKASRLYETTGK